ncbi:MAG: hypothetical protein RI973_1636 [Bacteroidota bacterium]
MNFQADPLEIQPNEAVWQKLEQKLEVHEQQGRVVPLHKKWKWAAAACIIAIGGAWLSINLDNQPTASSSLYAPPKNLEELPAESHCNFYCLSLKKRHALPEYYQQPKQKNT